MSAKHFITSTIAFVAITAAANTVAAELKQLPITGDWVDACDISGVRTVPGTQSPPSPPLPPGFPAPPAAPKATTLIEVSFYSNHPVLINVPKNEDAAVIKEKIAKMREGSACKSGEKK
jgi:hypothetical protein